MTVGVIQSQMPQDERRKAYAGDVTYGTANEFGFDFLRDRLLLRRTREGQTDIVSQMLGNGTGSAGEKPVQRQASFVLVDEADSILIDEARTPLIISALPDEAQRAEAELYQMERRGSAAIRRGRALRLRSRKTNRRADRRRPPAGSQLAPQRLGRASRHAHAVRFDRTGDPRQSIVHSRSALRGARRRDCDRRRIHRPPVRRPQVARRIASGHRGQGKRGGHHRHRPCRPRHHSGLFPALSAAGRHDRHGRHFGPRAAKDLQGERGANSDASPANSRETARANFRHRGR